MTVAREIGAGLDPHTSPEEHPGRCSDEELVRLAWSDRERFSLLYERYADRLYRYLLARARSPESAADIVGDAMAEAFERIHEYRPERGRFSTWIFTIANRRLIDRQRRQGRWRRFLSSHRKSANVSPDAVLDLVVRREEGGRVYAALDGLSETNQRIVILRFAGGLNSVEIGELLDLSPGAVRMRLQRSLRVLASELEDDV